MPDLERCESLHSVRMLRELVRRWFGRPVAIAEAQVDLDADSLGIPIRVGSEVAGYLVVSGLPESTEPVRREKLHDLLETVAQDVGGFLASRARPVQPPPEPFEGIVGAAAPMQALFRLLDKIVQSESTVLVLGESGTGKELVARAIHTRGPRKNKIFVAQNCSAITETLLESAMFGYVRGAFTGAVKDTKGLFEVADGGTFFLDEIGDMSPSLQVKLLRVLQDGTYTPVGGTSERRVNVRVIAATNKDLATAVQRGEFREDLYYRLNVIRLVVPPLRDRPEDIGTLVDHFLAGHNRGRATPIRLSGAVRQALEEYPWPGNVRELENEIERLTVLGSDQDEVDVDLLSARLLEVTAERHGLSGTSKTMPPAGTLRQALEDLERQMIRDGLVRTGGNKSQLAKELGISRSNLIAKVQQYGLEKQ
ncbi:MAG: sigma 54-interacting transcriptional regulator [Deltaproteobacteria bacterium]|nr:sigma 54-interacting transcriptional regulator [Deltaproteobacteria bacterium]